ncbi:MAG: putative undecaprenyl-phosphate N-acetylglucosaminyl 1-phosphate transferase [candidate division BRC1 bacterium ADurb.BinA364]|nr:MAG: putative undecaprenyl-phosphate N-acetylglucosaminyl 1-phosphate transferase [candidate division BRC1 bacterium ADurb.BinA364]
MRFNLARPAKTFMGDGGSQMIGYALALAALNAHPALVPGALIVFWPFIYDALYTLIRRARRGANLFEAHHEHLYQRLLEAGLSHAASRRRGAAFQLACLIASLGWAAASARGWSAWAHWLWWAVALGASALYTLDVWRIEARRRS